MSRGRSLVIGLCTYKRPVQLRGCLDSIAATELPVGPDIRILIADNDAAGSAGAIVDAFAAVSGLPIDYAIETGRGVPCARNNVLRRALALGTTEVAFIDDDEKAGRRWLAALWSHYLESSVDVVRGYVETEYPEDTPAWIRRGGFYQRQNHPTGTRFESAITGNVLFDFEKIVVGWGCWFDESIGMRGGSDSDFFRRARAKGAIISWTADSVVSETLERKRYALSYLLKRKFRTRNSEAFFKGLSPRKWIDVFARSVGKIIFGAISLPFSVFFGSHVVVRSLCRMVEGTGRLLGLFGAHIGWDEYHGE